MKPHKLLRMIESIAVFLGNEAGKSRRFGSYPGCNRQEAAAVNHGAMRHAKTMKMMLRFVSVLPLTALRATADPSVRLPDCVGPIRADCRDDTSNEFGADPSMRPGWQRLRCGMFLGLSRRSAICLGIREGVSRRRRGYPPGNLRCRRRGGASLARARRSQGRGCAKPRADAVLP